MSNIEWTIKLIQLQVKTLFQKKLLYKFSSVMEEDIVELIKLVDQYTLKSQDR